MGARRVGVSLADIARYIIGCHSTQETRVQAALDDVALDLVALDEVALDDVAVDDWSLP